MLKHLKTYRPPHKGAPLEIKGSMTPVEWKLIAALTDGKLEVTPAGELSAYMEGGPSGNYRDSSPSQSGTSNSTSATRGGSSNTNSGSSGTGGSTNQGRGGSPVGGNTTDRSTGGGGGNTNQGNTGTGGSMNAGRGGSGVGGGLGIGRDPAMGGNYGRGTLGMQQGGFNSQANQIARSVAAAVNRAGPQYTGPARYNQPFNANRSQQTFGGYPNSMSGMMPGQVNGFASPVNQVAELGNPSTFPARPSVIAANNISTPPAVSAMKKARQSTFPARPGVIAANNVYSPPEVSAIKREREFASSFPARPESHWSNIADIADAPIPRQNPLSDITKFNYQRNRPRDSVFSGVDQEAISRAVAAQAEFGKPVTVTSGMRTPLQNKNAEGVSRSQHMQGKALDFGISDTTGEDTASLISALKNAGFRGIGGYRPGKVHADIGPTRMWGPDTRASSIPSLPQNMRTAMYAKPQINTANAPAPPKATVMRNVVAPAIQGIRNMISPPSVPKPQPNPMRNRMATINPAGSTWTDDQPVNINPPGQEAIDRTAWANLQAMNDVGPQPPTNDIYGSGNAPRRGQGGQGGQGRGLSRLARAAKPTPVQGPTPPMPGFTWVQWFPGAPPAQIPTNALIGAA